MRLLLSSHNQSSVERKERHHHLPYHDVGFTVQLQQHTTILPPILFCVYNDQSRQSIKSLHRMNSQASTMILLIHLLLSPIIICQAWLLSPSWQRSLLSVRLLALPQQQQQQQAQAQALGSFEELSIPFTPHRKRQVLLLDWSDRLVDFDTAWKIQRDYLQQHLDRLDKNNNHNNNSDGFLPNDANTTTTTTTTTTGVDCILLLQHQPVYTLGTASDPANILVNNNNNNSNNNNNNDEHDCHHHTTTTTTTTIPTIRMDRGGEVTYHGPGQLTIYPVLDLRHYRTDIHWYVRALEEVVLRALALCRQNGAPEQRPQQRQQQQQRPHHHHNVTLTPTRDDSYTGVFVPGAGKIAAVGIKCRRWITQHGVALNVLAESKAGFEGIVPCGLTGPQAQVTSVNDFLLRASEHGANDRVRANGSRRSVAN